MEHIEIDISKIIGRRDRKARGRPDERSLMEESVGRLGILAPPVLARRGKQFELVAGAGRLAAAEANGLRTVDCVVLPDEADTPGARLAFIDENLARVELTSAERDGLLLTRRAILEKTAPETVGRGRTAAVAKKKADGAKRKGGKFKRGKPDSPPGGESGSTGIVLAPKAASSREMEEAKRRMSNTTETVKELYVEGKLSQRQMDLLAQVEDPELKEKVANVVAGKTVSETREMVKKAVAHEKLPSKQGGEFVRVFKTLVKACDALLKAASEYRRVQKATGFEPTGPEKRDLAKSVQYAHTELERLLQMTEEAA